jgi:methylated-DNA-[protein]-cysteine S-methyltransferase
MNIENALSQGPRPADFEASRAAFLLAAEGSDLVDVAYAMHDSPFGELLVAATPRGLAAVSLRDHEETLDRLARRVSPRLLEAPARTDAVRRELDEYFEGNRTRFELELDLSLAGGFRLDVLHELDRVPYGETTTYGELARQAGRPRAFRAVGTTMATNPIALVLPCHRVLPSGGGLGNYGGGVEMKRSLLELEGIDTEDL